MPIVGMIFFIIHVIYTMLHLFIYCYVGETLLGQVESFRVDDKMSNCPISVFFFQKMDTGFFRARVLADRRTIVIGTIYHRGTPFY